MIIQIDRIILASKSSARQMILKKHNIKFKAMPTNVDETKFTDPSSGANQALLRAKAKASYALQNYDDCNALVIAADQTLECNGRIFDKAKTVELAFEKLKFLSNKSHKFNSGVVVGVIHKNVKKVLFEYIDYATVTLHDLDDSTIKEYLQKGQWQGSVGCYRLESDGKELIKHKTGDDETIIGLSIKKLNSYMSNYNIKLSSELKFPFALKV